MRSLLKRSSSCLELSSASSPGLRSVLIVSVLSLVSVSPAYAIDPNRKVSQYVHDHWGAEQGVPRGSIYAITQTADGYLWIGSEEGLFRFDGFNFRQISDPSGSITLTSVVGLVADKEGSLWLRLRDTTLIRYRNGEFEYPPEQAAYITATARGNLGELIAGEMQLGAFAFTRGAWQLLSSATTLPRSPVLSITQTANGDIWMGTRGAGLYRFRDGKVLSVTTGLPDPKVNCLLPDSDRTIWIGTDQGIIRWDGSKLTGAALANVQALAMARDRDGNVWVGSDSRGLLRVNAGGVSALDSREYGSGAAVTAVFEDREGDVWAGSSNGIERLRDSAFITYSDPEGLPTDGPNPVFVDSTNRTWFSPVDGGLWWFRGDDHGRISADGLDRDVVYSITGGVNELWVGRERGGLTRLQLKDESYSARSYTRADGLAQNNVYCVYRTRNGVIWAGTLSGGLSAMADGHFTTYTTATGLTSNSVVSIAEAADGTMWFATPTGLSSFSAGHWRAFTTTDGLPSGTVNCLLGDSKGVLWIGTTSGLSCRDITGFHSLGNLPPSLREQVFGLAEDKLGSIWLATSNGVLRVNRDRLFNGALRDGDLRLFGLSDGLRGMEGVKRHRSVAADSAGRIWFSLNRGISVVDPVRLTNASALAVAHIESISVDGREIAVNEPVRIVSGHHRLVFGYSGLCLSVPERVMFRYRLDGFDRGWSEPASERQAVYTNLPPANYRFRLIASNPDGLWSLTEAGFAFTVAPAVWQTWWFRLLFALACIAALSALYRFRLQYLTSQLNTRFEERLAERTRIARELHDTLLQGFISASMHVHVASNRLPEDSRAKSSLARATQLMTQVIEEGRNAVRGLRSREGASLDLEQAFSQVQTELASEEEVARDIQFRVIVEGQPRPLRPVLREEAYRIGREALVNAFRHALAKRIELELKYSSAGLLILVRDDGHGIDPETLSEGREGHWGLSGMRERADRVGARLRLWSSPGHGTEIELLVPSQIAFGDYSGSILRWLRGPRREDLGAKTD